MNLDQVIAKREKKTIYRDGEKAVKVFNEDFSKADMKAALDYYETIKINKGK